jgi:hypothetical protein
MKTKTSFYVIYLSVLLISLSSCSMLSNVSDDDVYVLSTPTLESSEELNDESSYQNYRYQKTRQHQNINYGFSFYRGTMFFRGSPYSYHGSFPMYSGFYSHGANMFYHPFYNNYYGYMDYPYIAHMDYPGSFFYANYPMGWYGNNFNYSNWNMNNGGGSASSIHYNTHYSARNSISGTGVSRRQANQNTFGGMTGMATKPGSKTNRYDYARAENIKNPSRVAGIKTVSTRPIERGVGLSKQGTRVTSVSYERTGTVPAYQRSSNEKNTNFGRSGNNLDTKKGSPSASPSRNSSAPTPASRRK